jgi:hypothetical protein
MGSRKSGPIAGTAVSCILLRGGYGYRPAHVVRIDLCNRPPSIYELEPEAPEPVGRL